MRRQTSASTAFWSASCTDTEEDLELSFSERLLVGINLPDDLGQVRGGEGSAG
jgi:hypothetical protein